MVCQEALDKSELMDLIWTLNFHLSEGVIWCDATRRWFTYTSVDQSWSFVEAVIMAKIKLMELEYASCFISIIRYIKQK